MRIWVTGIGIVSPLGGTAAETMTRLLAGERAFRPLSLFELPGARAGFAAEIEAEVLARLQAPGLSRTDRMAILAAREALASAGLAAEAGTYDLVLAGTTSGLFETEHLLAEMARDPAALRPLRQMLSHPLSATVDRMRAQGIAARRARTLCSACSGGANALCVAASWLRTGRSDRVLAGGADGLSRLTFAGFNSLGALAPEPCRPFDRRRQGMSLGEGAAFLLLETAESARARGAQPLAELRGWAIGAEAHHITNPEPAGTTAARLMARALERARLAPTELDYVNAHGTATTLNDAMEARALASALGAELGRIRVSSCKGQIGHTLGAAGAIEAAVCALALAQGVVPPTGGLEQVDPECAALRHVLQVERTELRAALSSSFGFGGTDSVLVLAAPERFPALPDALRQPVLVTAAASVGPLGVCAGLDGARYLEAGNAPPPGAIDFDASRHLEIERARRVDRPGRLATVAMQAALRNAGIDALPADRAARVGALVGTAYGPVDGSASFVQRVFEKGAKGAVPAHFPNHVPSSPVAHAAIYLGLRGPVFATSDLDATAEGAMVTAVELLEADEASLLVAGSVEELSPIAERVLGPLCLGTPSSTPRSEGAAVLVLENTLGLRARAAAAGALPAALAAVAWVGDWRGESGAALATLPAPPAPPRALVLVGRDGPEVDRALASSAWRQVERRACLPRCGSHEGAGGFAAAAAAAELGAARREGVLVLGVARDRGYAMLLVPARTSEVGPAP